MNWVGIALVFTLGAPSGGGMQALKAPASIHAEHEEIHADLLALTKVAGPVGAAASKLAAVLHPHFEREEEIALPPLGLLGPLSRGENPAGTTDGARMADTLKGEMPRMLKEHEAIRAAVTDLRRTGEREKHAKALAFADKLALHAQTEEEVLYPAAILVGDLVRARARSR